MPTKKKQTDTTEATFTGPNDQTTITLYKGMVNDLPPLWNIRYEDLVQSFLAGEIGGAEFSLKLCAVFTHLPDVPGNQRLDPRQIERGVVSDRDAMREMMQVGVQIMDYLRPDQEESEGDSKNA